MTYNKDITPSVSKKKITFGQQLRFKIKVAFGEIYLEHRQMNWNVAIINANVVVDELPSQIIIYTCLTINIWSRRSRHAVLCALVPSAQNVGLLVKLAPNFFDFTMDIPSSPESA
jgi:hypothetical protein